MRGIMQVTFDKGLSVAPHFTMVQDLRYMAHLKDLKNIIHAGNCTFYHSPGLEFSSLPRG